ncbi:MAG TPA: UDP-N-acetylmuramoyl-tripeptide--D-alanyl-D-alanine ligase, partial [Firmicutes bacterium]|nr:UDP-N-acetylmuramoyl-tripeptide--D-alanyl-D-alanine ligase [Bacillota bacterium]
MLFTVGEAAEVTGARLLPGSDTGEGSDVPILAVTHDSRQVQPGALFVALPGANTDGHLFLAEAFAGGAVAALVSRMVNPPPSRPCLLVPDTVLALGRLARWYRQRFRPVVVGITGSLGKTSTKDLAAAVLGTRWQVLCNQGNLNTEVGVPLTLLRLNGSVQVALIEMAMRGHGQIRYLADLAAPSMGVITNVSESHLELLGSVEEVARAKAELLEALPPGGLAVLNADDPRVRDMGRQFPGRVVYFALETAQPAEAAALVFASEVRSLGEEGTAFLLHLPVREPVPVHLPVPGRHQVSNALAAAALGWILGLSPEEIKRGLEHPRLSAMRMEVRRYGETVLINDAYNASPTSTAAALRVLMEVTGRRHLAVLADMLELG